MESTQQHYTICHWHRSIFFQNKHMVEHFFSDLLPVVLGATNNWFLGLPIGIGWFRRAGRGRMHLLLSTAFCQPGRGPYLSLMRSEGAAPPAPRPAQARGCSSTCRRSPLAVGHTAHAATDGSHCQSVICFEIYEQFVNNLTYIL